MSTLFRIVAVFVPAALLYLLAWPTPVAPVAWEAPEDQGYVGVFAPNTDLAEMERISLGDLHGPEDVTAREEDGALVLYVSTQSGAILKIDPQANTVSTFVDTGGVPLGLGFDGGGSLIVADAFLGLLSIAPDATVTLLTNEVAGTPILYANNLDIAPDGVIYFSDASTKFGAEASGSTLQGARYEILEHGQTGRILAYDPASDETEVIAEGLSFANGIAMAPDGRSVLVNETGSYRVLRVNVTGPDKGEMAPILSNLPGFPDNINPGPVLDDGTPTYFLGLFGPRLPVIDALDDQPFLRKMIVRLPNWAQPAPVHYGFVVQFTADGRVIRTWQDPAGGYPTTTGAFAPGDGYLYVSSLEAHDLGRVAYP